MTDEFNATPNITLNTDEKLLLVCQPSFRFTCCAWMLKTWAFIVSAIILLVLLNLEGVKNLIGTSQTIGEGKVMGIIIFILSLLIYFFGLRFIHQKYHFYFTDSRCIYDFHLLSRDQKTVPYSRIFNIEVKQNLLQYFLGIANVYLNTQNMSSPDLSASYFPVLFGLSKADADKINQIIGSRVPRS